MMAEEIIAKLPYSKPFLFVDEIEQVNASEISGYYRFTEDEYFYRGHFSNFAVTPGVILVECMAQIGLVSHGIYLLHQQQKPLPSIVAFSQADVQFLMPVFPGERVRVVSNLIYFRMGKIKSNISLYTPSGEVACRGELSGLMRA